MTVSLCKNVRLRGCSNTSTRSVVTKHFARVGTMMRWLNAVSAEEETTETETPRGEIFKATATFISRFLRRIQTRVYAMRSTSVTPLSLSAALRGTVEIYCIGIYYTYIIYTI